MITVENEPREIFRGKMKTHYENQLARLEKQITLCMADRNRLADHLDIELYPAPHGGVVGRLSVKLALSRIEQIDLKINGYLAQYAKTCKYLERVVTL